MARPRHHSAGSLNDSRARTVPAFWSSLPVSFRWVAEGALLAHEGLGLLRLHRRACGQADSPEIEIEQEG